MVLTSKHTPSNKELSSQNFIDESQMQLRKSSPVKKDQNGKQTLKVSKSSKNGRVGYSTQV